VYAPTTLPSAALRMSARVMDRAATAAPAWPPDVHTNGRGVSSVAVESFKMPQRTTAAAEITAEGSGPCSVLANVRQHRFFWHWSRPRLTAFGLATSPMMSQPSVTKNGC